MNGDLLTQVNLDLLLAQHVTDDCALTVGVKRYAHQIPYGCVTARGRRLLRLEEKPMVERLVNAGIYVLSPDALDYVVTGETLDMTTLFERAVGEGRTVSVFPLQEYWIDIGRMEDLERARADFNMGAEA